MTKRVPIDKSRIKNFNADPKRVRLGREPFRTGVAYYEVKKQAYLTQTTIEENTRKLYYFADAFREMKDNGLITTLDPRHMGVQEIEAFMIFMKNNKLQNTTKKKYLSILDSFLGFWGNHVISDMKKQNKFASMSKGKKRPITYIEEEDLRTIFKAIDTYPGYQGIVIRGFISLIFGIAGRPKEVIDALLEDLDLDEERFYIRHPKGEGSWGLCQWIVITRKDMIPKLERFLNEREEYLKGINRTSEYLFVNPSTGRPYSLQTIRIIKERIEEETGIDFKLKEFRSTYATITYKHNKNMKDAISKQLRHQSPKTTDDYYIAYDQKQASKDLADEWEKSKIE
mgnify:CR=1 FL=1